MIYVTIVSLVIAVFNAMLAIARLWHLRRGREEPSRNSAILLVIAHRISAFTSSFILFGTSVTPTGEDFLFLIGGLFLGGELATSALSYRATIGSAPATTRSTKTEITRPSCKQCLGTILCAGTIRLRFCIW
jgi:hypothetical protein